MSGMRANISPELEIQLPQENGTRRCRRSLWYMRWTVRQHVQPKASPQKMSCPRRTSNEKSSAKTVQQTKIRYETVHWSVWHDAYMSAVWQAFSHADRCSHSCRNDAHEIAQSSLWYVRQGVLSTQGLCGPYATAYVRDAVPMWGVFAEIPNGVSR